MRTALVFAALLGAAEAVAQQEQEDPSGGRAAIASDFFMPTGDTVALCLRPEAHWQDFCNGLVQGYAEHAVLTGKACIPPGTNRRRLVEVFTGPDVVVSTGYIDDHPAYETAIEMFIRHFPCP
jgi:hypothetical protein